MKSRYRVYSIKFSSSSCYSRLVDRVIHEQIQVAVLLAVEIFFLSVAWKDQIAAQCSSIAPLAGESSAL
jgi:hypothetical protein